MLIKLKKTGTLALTAKAFSEKVVGTNLELYAKRKQTNPKTIAAQILVGKLAECGVFVALKSLGVETTAPDFEIYEAKKKSYDSDLALNLGGVRYPLHIKAMEGKTAKKYGLSWTFQKGRGGTDSEIFFKKGGGFIVFCEVSEDSDSVFVDLKFFLELSVLQEKKELFKEPVVWQLRNSKRVVYAADLSDLGLESPKELLMRLKTNV